MRSQTRPQSAEVMSLICRDERITLQGVKWLLTLAEGIRPMHMRLVCWIREISVMYLMHYGLYCLLVTDNFFVKYNHPTFVMLRYWLV